MFIFGLGYVGTAFARHLKKNDWQVCGTCTNVNKALELRNEGISTYLFDDLTLSGGQSDEVRQDIITSDCVLSTIPPILPNRDLVLEAHGDDLKQGVLKNNLKWIGYLSSTGVYGDCGGAWVKEDRPVNPDNEKTKARADAESYWAQLFQRGGLPVHIFRLAGIYGPERSAIDTLLKFPEDSLKIPVDDVTYVSRIHVDDIVKVLAAAIKIPSPGEVYNVADDLPSTRYDILSYICRMYNLPDVQLSSKSSDGNSRSGSKRVDNSKMKRLLLAAEEALTHPDYRSGLTAMMPLYQKQIEEKFFRVKDTSNENREVSKKLSEEGGSLNQLEFESLQRKVQELAEKVQILENDRSIIMNALNEINDAIRSL